MRGSISLTSVSRLRFGPREPSRITKEEPADAGALAIAKLNGLDLSQHRARYVRDQDFREFDLILALDEHNLRDLRARCPRAEWSRLVLLLDFAPGSGHRGVPDPYGESLDVFAHSLSLIRAGVDGLSAHVVSGDGDRV